MYVTIEKLITSLRHDIKYEKIHSPQPDTNHIEKLTKMIKYAKFINKTLMDNGYKFKIYQQDYRASFILLDTGDEERFIRLNYHFFGYCVEVCKVDITFSI